jgi:hypothetical protein
MTQSSPHRADRGLICKILQPCYNLDSQQHMGDTKADEVLTLTSKTFCETLSSVVTDSNGILSVAIIVTNLHGNS